MDANRWATARTVGAGVFHTDGQAPPKRSHRDGFAVTEP